MNFEILAIMIGAVYSGSSCISPDIPFNLGTWLFCGGIGCIAASMLTIFCELNENIGWLVTVAILKICFMIAWFIIGVNLMLTIVTIDVCNKQNCAIYVMSIIYLVYLAVSFFGIPIVIMRERELLLCENEKTPHLARCKI